MEESGGTERRKRSERDREGCNREMEWRDRV